MYIYIYHILLNPKPGNLAARVSAIVTSESVMVQEASSQIPNTQRHHRKSHSDIVWAGGRREGGKAKEKATKRKQWLPGGGGSRTLLEVERGSKILNHPELLNQATSRRAHQRSSPPSPSWCRRPFLSTVFWKTQRFVDVPGIIVGTRRCLTWT